MSDQTKVDDPKNIIQTAISMVFEHSIQRPTSEAHGFNWAHAKQIDWKAYTDAIWQDYEQLTNLRTPDLIDAYGIINRALYRLDDGGHSRINYRGYFQIFGNRQEYLSMMNKPWDEQRRYIEQKHRRQESANAYDPPNPHFYKEDDSLYIWLPSFDGPADLQDLTLSENTAENRTKIAAAKRRIQYEDSILEQLKRCANDGTRCIILDLRDNHGGFLSPMLYSLLPLFVHGSASRHLLQPATSLVNIRHRNSSTPIDIVAIAKQFSSSYSGRSCEYYAPNLLNMPVAVLCGNNTCSAGEFIMLALRSRGNSRSFGQPTGGLTTWSYNAMLPGSACIHIVNGIMSQTATAHLTAQQYPS